MGASDVGAQLGVRVGESEVGESEGFEVGISVVGEAEGDRVGESDVGHALGEVDGSSVVGFCEGPVVGRSVDGDNHAGRRVEPNGMTNRGLLRFGKTVFWGGSTKTGFRRKVRAQIFGEQRL